MITEIQDIQGIKTKGVLIFKRCSNGGICNFAIDGISILSNNSECTVKYFKKSQEITVKFTYGWSGSLYLYKDTLYAVKDNGDIKQYKDWKAISEKKEDFTKNILKDFLVNEDDPEFLKLVLSSQS